MREGVARREVGEKGRLSKCSSRRESLAPSRNADIDLL